VYNTTLTVALKVLAGVSPLDLELLQILGSNRIGSRLGGAMKMGSSEARKVQYGNNTVNLWQGKWVTSDRGRWTESGFRTQDSAGPCVVQHALHEPSDVKTWEL